MERYKLRVQRTACSRKTHKRARAHVLANRVGEIDAYVCDLGIETGNLTAAMNTPDGQRRRSIDSWPAQAYMSMESGPLEQR